MRGVYTASLHISGVNSARTLLHLTAPADQVVEVLSASVENASNETNEQMRVALQRITTLGTPTDTDLTPSKHEEADQACGSLVAANVTASEPSYTANTELGHAGFSSLGGWGFDPVPECRPTVKPGGSIGIRLLSPASPTAFDCVVTITFREIG